MAIATSISSGPGAMWQQVQSQQAQRMADQAEQTARTLQMQARDARASADRAQRSARDLEVKATQAQDKAVNARQGVTAANSINDMQSKQAVDYSNLPQTIAYAKQGAADGAAASLTVSSTSQTLGTLVNTTA